MSTSDECNIRINKNCKKYFNVAYKSDNIVQSLKIIEKSWLSLLKLVPNNAIPCVKLELIDAFFDIVRVASKNWLEVKYLALKLAKYSKYSQDIYSSQNINNIDLKRKEILTKIKYEEVFLSSVEAFTKVKTKLEEAIMKITELFVEAANLEIQSVKNTMKDGENDHSQNYDEEECLKFINSSPSEHFNVGLDDAMVSKSVVARAICNWGCSPVIETCYNCNKPRKPDVFRKTVPSANTTHCCFDRQLPNESKGIQCCSRLPKNCCRKNDGLVALQFPGIDNSIQ